MIGIRYRLSSGTPAVARRVVCLLLCMLATIYIRGQQIDMQQYQLLLDDYLESDELPTNLYEQLQEWADNPLQINTAAREDLDRFFFLPDSIKDHIIAYREKYGYISSPVELRMVKGIDARRYHLLEPFLRFDIPTPQLRQPNLQTRLKHGHHTVLCRMEIPLYLREGFRAHHKNGKETPRKYLGSPWQSNLRYQFHSSDQMYAGFIADKDAGEPFFARYNRKGFDHYGAYVFVRNIGRIKALALGDYRLHYGSGMVINTDFSLGKSMMLQQFTSTRRGINKHSSTDEVNFLRGAAISLHLSPAWQTDFFYSFRQMDGTVDNLFITSLKKDGYHRTRLDMNKREKVQNQLFGTHITYQRSRFQLGATAVYYFFNKPIRPVDKSYNRYALHGRQFTNIGLDYRLQLSHFSISGETGIDQSGAKAWFSQVSYTQNAQIQWLLINRWYDVLYQSFYAKAIAESSTIQNERGVYIGLSTKPIEGISLSAYTDWFYFPFRKYGISKSRTQGWESTFLAQYTPSYQLQMLIKYRIKSKPKDVTTADRAKYTHAAVRNHLRYNLLYRPAPQWTLKGGVEGVFVRMKDTQASNGWLTVADVSYHPQTKPILLQSAIVYFHTHDYRSRITLYERSAPFALSMPSFFGHGMRFVLNTRYEFGTHWQLHFKYGVTNYFDRHYIGDGPARIPYPAKNDILLQLRIKL